MNSLKLWALIATVVIFCSGAAVGLLGKDVAASSRRSPIADVVRTNDSLLVEELGLSREQGEKLRAIWSDAIAQAGPPPVQQIDAIQRDREAAVRALLTDAQRAAYDKIVSEYEERLIAAHEKTRAAFRAAEERTAAILDDRQRVKYFEILKRAPTTGPIQVFHLKVPGGQGERQDAKTPRQEEKKKR